MYNKQYTLHLKLIEKRTVNYNSIINQLIIIITTTIIIYLLNNLYTHLIIEHYHSENQRN